jgi:hypothetical protein
MPRYSPVVLVALCLFVPVTAQAAKVKVWHHWTPAHYEKARLQGAVVSSEGALRLSRHLKPFAALDASHVWDIVEDKAGNLFVATGDEGRIYKVTPGGEVSTAYTSDDSEILCLALAPDGSIYAGTGPGGHLLRITPDGKTKVIYHSGESYIWSVGVDPSGETIYAGTGPKGRIYRVTSEGKAKLYYETRQDHILSLAMAPDGTLYAGTDKNGLVYRFDDKGKGFVLFHAPQSEVRSLRVAPDGVYAGTSAPSRRSGGSQPNSDRPPSSQGKITALPSRSSSRPVGGGTTLSVTDSSATAPKEKETPSSAVPAPPPPSSGENSIYRLVADGTVREVFREKAMILSLLNMNGRLFIGTGMDGQLFEVDEATKERSEIARLDHGEIHSLCRRQDGSVVVGTGDPGKLYVLQEKYTAKGTIVSDVLDAKLVSRWGALNWSADTPAGTKVTLAVRSGNLADPDETWSDWSEEQTDPEHGLAAAPPARFLQYRVSLATEDSRVTPTLRRLSIRYMTKNQAPEVTSIEVPDLDAVNVENPKKLRIRWSAVDPNEDDLSYNLYIRKDGWKSWVLLEENYEKREYDWDTTTTPAGMYQLKVVASDRKDNAPEDALTGERISAAFAVAHTPPVVKLKMTGIEGSRAAFEATATDPLVRLTGAAFSINGKKWVNVFPVNSLFDSTTATFRFQTAVLKPGTYVIVLRVRDAAGNIGSGDAVFTVPAAGSK